MFPFSESQAVFPQYNMQIDISVHHIHVAKTTCWSSGEWNEKSGSIDLTSVNMSVTLSLKVCQQTDQTDKPELSWECNPTNKVVDRQLGSQHSSPDMFNPVWVWQKCTLTRTTVTLSDKTHWFITCALNSLLYWATQVFASCSVFDCGWTDIAVLSLFLFFFLVLPRLTVEILCCSAKALHLPVITSHPSLLRLPGVEPPCALCAPLPHPIPSPPTILYRHVVTAAIMLSAPWALHLELVGKAWVWTLLLLWCLPPASCCPLRGPACRRITSQCHIHPRLNPALFTGKDWQAVFK